MSSHDTLLQILELARWAPSGDNTQPWRFEIVDDAHVVVHGFDTRSHCVYDLDGHASQVSLGALIETASIAASTFGLRMTCQRRTELPDEQPTFDLRFTASDDVKPDPLAAAIKTRTVQRRPLKTRPLSAEEKAAIQASLPDGYRLLWIEGSKGRWDAARLMFRSAKLRLTIPEAYEVHRDIIEWDAQFSEQKVPDQALGADPLTLRLMKVVMKSWSRVNFFNKYLGGTIAPRLQMDLLPGIACGAHYALYHDKPPASIDDYVAGGRAMQRLWLTVAWLGLLMQPQITPLVFARFAREGRNFSATPGARASAQDISSRLDALLGQTIAPATVYMGRVGAGTAPSSRSTRRPLAELMHKAGAPH